MNANQTPTISSHNGVSVWNFSSTSSKTYLVGQQNFATKENLTRILVSVWRKYSVWSCCTFLPYEANGPHHFNIWAHHPWNSRLPTKNTNTDDLNWSQIQHPLQSKERLSLSQTTGFVKIVSSWRLSPIILQDHDVPIHENIVTLVGIVKCCLILHNAKANHVRCWQA